MSCTCITGSSGTSASSGSPGIMTLKLSAHAQFSNCPVKGQQKACKAASSPAWVLLVCGSSCSAGVALVLQERGMEPGDHSEEEETQFSGGGEDGPLETPLATRDRAVGQNGEGDGSASEEGETSDSASSNSSSSSSGSSTSSETAARSPGGMAEDGALMQTDEYGDHFHVNCAGNAAKFYLNRFARGSIGRCVLFRARWITPNEFQAISGRQSSKDWKRSIRLRGRCLKEYITQGLFQEHLKTCACQICSGEAAEHLRLEGEMALAAKRRRLSQADGGGGQR